MVQLVCVFAIDQMSHAGAKLKISIQSFSWTRIFSEIDLENVTLKKATVWSAQNEYASVVGASPAGGCKVGQILNFDFGPHI